MKHKLVSAAVAAAIGAVPMAVQADSVTVYGRIWQEIAWADVDGPTGTSGIRIDDTGTMSRLGVKAVKDLGNGLEAIGVWESAIEACGTLGGTGNGTGCRADFSLSRQQFIGLQGSFGRIAFGRFNGTYKTFGGVTYDAFVATSMQARANGGMGGGDFLQNAFMDDVVEWQSPKFGMAKIQIQYGLDDKDNPDGAGNTKGDYNIGIKIGDKNWEAIAVASHDDNDSGRQVDGETCNQPDGECDNWKVGGKINMGPARITVQYEDVESGGDGKGEFLFGQVVYKMGKNDLIATLGTFDGDAGNDRDVFALGIRHHLGKKVAVYAGYRSTDNDTAADKDSAAIGLQMNF